MWVVQTNHCHALEEPFPEGWRLWPGKCAIPNSNRSHAQHYCIPQTLWRYPKTWRLSAEIQHFNSLYPLCPGTGESYSRAAQMCLQGSAKAPLCSMACSAHVVEQESSCAQWAGASGVGSSMGELRDFLGCVSFLSILTPTAEQVFWNEDCTEKCPGTVTPWRPLYCKGGICQALSPWSRNKHVPWSQWLDVINLGNVLSWWCRESCVVEPKCELLRDSLVLLPWCGGSSGRQTQRNLLKLTDLNLPSETTIS